MRLRPSAPFLRLALLTAVAVAVHGYHFGTDDGAVYLPAVVHSIHPELYPYGAEFFESHADLSIFTAVVGASARFFHLNVEWTVFLWHLLTVFAYLLAAWRLASVCFDSARARWSAVSLSCDGAHRAGRWNGARPDGPLPHRKVGFDASEHVSSREPFLPATAVKRSSGSRLPPSCIRRWHSLPPDVVIILALPAKWTAPLFEAKPVGQAPLPPRLPLGFSFGPATPEYHQALEMRTFLSVLHWRWYEWLGVAAPLGSAHRVQPATTARSDPRLQPHQPRAHALRNCRDGDRRHLRLQREARNLPPPAADARLPTHLHRLLPAARRPARRICLEIPLLALGRPLRRHRRRASFSSSDRTTPTAATSNGPAPLRSIPGSKPSSGYAITRRKTPSSHSTRYYIELPGEDQHGFRGIAQRSVLTDHFKDSGVVSLFPQLAPEWAREQQAQQNWNQFPARRLPATRATLSRVMGRAARRATGRPQLPIPKRSRFSLPNFGAAGLKQKYSYRNAEYPPTAGFPPPGKSLQRQSPAHDPNCTSALK